MAARINKIRHDDETRAKIQATQLIKRLTDHALSEVPIMESTQVKAIEILLKKTLPDLSNVQHSGDANNPLVVLTRRIIEGTGHPDSAGLPAPVEPGEV